MANLSISLADILDVLRAECQDSGAESSSRGLIGAVDIDSASSRVTISLDSSATGSKNEAEIALRICRAIEKISGVEKIVILPFPRNDSTG